MLTPILATDDPYEAAVFMKAGWSPVFLTPPESGERAFHAVLLGYRFLIAAGG